MRGAPRFVGPALLAALLAAACGGESAPEPSAASAGASAGASADACRVVRSGVLLPPELHEASGVAVSRQRAPLLWMINDSGNDNVLYAVRPTGEVAGRLEVPGARNRDWEDLALARCGTGDCLYIADIGDNDAERDEVVVYRLAEPEPGAGSAGPVEALRMRYPEGPRDAEALFVLPDERLFVVTKGRDAPVELFRYPGPPRPGETVTLERVRRLDGVEALRGQLVTAAEAAPGGDRVALRTYDTLALFETPALLDAGAPAQTASLTPLQQPQGEGVALRDDGAVVLTSEGGPGNAPASMAGLHCAP